MSATAGNADRTTLIALTANLDIGDTADPALRLAYFQYMTDLSDANYNYVRSLVTSGTLSPLPPEFMGRQAIINGNFDVWQRGTSFGATGSLLYVADRWSSVNNPTNQASVVSRQDGSGVAGSVYCLRYRRNLGETGINTMSLAYSLETQDSKKLIGNKLTLSFWARVGPSSSSSLLNVYILSGTGTDQNVLSGFTGAVLEGSQTVTLTTSWQKITLTTASTIAATKTQIGCQFSYTPTGTAAENDFFEITQVQLCTGGEDLPFQPRSYADELTLCQRFYEKSYDIGVTPGNAANNGAETFIAEGTTFLLGKANFKVRKRVAPTVNIYAPVVGTQDAVNGALDGTAYTITSVATVGETGIQILQGSGFTGGSLYRFQYTADAEL